MTFPGWRQLGAKAMTAKRQLQAPGLECEFYILLSASHPSRTPGWAGWGGGVEAGSPHGDMAWKLTELGEVLEKTRRQQALKHG